ncbi:LysR family transcriptional regulator [Actinoplanes sp. OR16]|uniref:LysR family transcriptional regulator n=1 Tax=Actinoplanes sp. OR16 TaxID=946334 RepID=UPI000F6BE18F|nr:LysR family transcriptional regulator [Actinoplanes sp. OR16]BBH69515.1 LysR family transcriptional regulator [Actinoplanes sp. OR16]
MDPKLLTVLLELARLGSMRAVADVMRTSTSTISQQIATLGRQAGAELLERDGRGVRLSPAGRRLAGHAVTILAAVDAARADLDPDAEPAGVVRVAGSATTLRRAVIPVITSLAGRRSGVQVLVSELEPGEATEALLTNQIDLALVYDYNLAPAARDPSFASRPLWQSDWGLGVPAEHAAGAGRLPSPELFARFAGTAWIGNPRNPAEEAALRVIAAMAGFEPRLYHHADSLDLVEDLIVTGSGVGLLPIGRATRPGVVVQPLRDPAIHLRIFAWTKRGRLTWPPLAMVLGLLSDHGANDAPEPGEAEARTGREETSPWPEP